MGLFSEKPEYWQVFVQPLEKAWDTEFAFRQEYRLQTANFKLVQVRYSFMAKQEVATNVNFGLHYSYLLSRDPKEDPFLKRHLLEVEINPSVEMTKSIIFKMRNRYELTKIENESKLSSVFRQRHQFVFKVKKNSDMSLKSFSIYDEVFYNINSNALTEYRFYPIELTFSPYDKYNLSIFLMTRWRKSNDHWNPQFAFGTNMEW